MIRLDDTYADKLEDFVADNSAFMQIVSDVNVEYDAYFYERKAHLQKTIDSIDNGEMKLFSESEALARMEKIEEKLIEKYAN